MSKVRMFSLVGGLVFVWFAASGCVSRDEYLRVDFARRKQAERIESLERELADCRAQVASLEKERESLHQELDEKTALAATLQAENERLEALRKRLQDELAKAGALGDVQVVEVKLPAALDYALRKFAEQYPDAVEYDPKRGAVRWKSDLTFDLGSDVVRDSVKASLKAFADIVNSASARSFEVVVVGHTDNVPISPTTAKKFPTNWHLSAHRAVSVMFVLHDDGVQYERMGVMGYGEHRPRVPNPARGGEERNRRVEIFLVGRGEQPDVGASAGGVGEPASASKAPARGGQASANLAAPAEGD